MDNLIAFVGPVSILLMMAQDYAIAKAKERAAEEYFRGYDLGVINGYKQAASNVYEGTRDWHERSMKLTGKL
ncbi:hypothetical protein [Methylocystis heyeri]|uniref:Uncharacterized protein n=1 Tax=Methylocystis heyeri TaxID=391905 RepID=A0A6B8KEU8_9HYPH|nr:hypothetical protein [Methylocystis heyeri]QGM46149.1 hypothetical protein H2LOC_010825 [Methylocystis heyeri]